MPLDEAKEPSTQWAGDLASASMTLARRTAAGATLWCWSPRWPQHAEHLAVEFVHPVVVGTRALPAEAITGPDPVAALRAVVEPGDVLVVVADASASEVADVFRPASAWGVRTVWIGCGPRPGQHVVDHLIWLDEVGSTDPAFDGRLVLSYHVLWELTHVCYEHPGLLEQSTEEGPESGDEQSCDAAGHCITCSDDGRLAEVLEAASGGGTLVRTPSGIEDIDVSLVGPVSPGDLLLVHAGVALSRLGEEA